MKLGIPGWPSKKVSKDFDDAGKNPTVIAHGHNRDDKPGRGLGHDREDKNGLALGHREETSEKSQEDGAATSVGGAAGSACSDSSILFVGADPDEMIYGACGDDELYGGAGSDVILGGAGHDYLSGNWGNDTLMGGDGADTFSFDGDFDRDTVTDFTLADGDRLDFIFYEAHQTDWTVQMLLDLFVQSGRDAILELPQSDEVVILENVEASALSADSIFVTDLYVQDALFA